MSNEERSKAHRDYRHANTNQSVLRTSLLPLQRSAGNYVTQRLLEPSKREPNIQRDPNGVLNTEFAVEKLEQLQDDSNFALLKWLDWQLANWTDFVGHTSSDPSLGLADSELAGLTSNVVGNFLTDFTLKEAIASARNKSISAIKKSAAGLGAALGTAAAPVAGTAIGFCLGVLIESVASWMFDNVTGVTDADEAAAEGAHNATAAIEKVQAGLVRTTMDMQIALNSLFKAARDNARFATSEDQLNEIVSWAVSESAMIPDSLDRDNRALRDTLLKEWVLEHAGDEEDARKGTNEVEWEKAVDAVFKVEHLDNHPEIFAYQSRLEWSKAGLDHASTSSALVKNVQDKASIISPATLRHKFDGEKYTFNVRDHHTLEEYIKKHGWMPQYAHIAKTHLIVCTMDLTDWDGSVYVNKWKFFVDYDSYTDFRPDVITAKWAIFTVSPD